MSPRYSSCGCGIHSCQTGNLLTGAHLAPGGEIRSGVSCDQVIAERMRDQTKVPNLVLKAGDSIRVQTPGAGGFGACDDRPIERIAQDIRDGMISRAAAERDYGADHVRAAMSLIGQGGKAA